MVYVNGADGVAGDPRQGHDEAMIEGEATLVEPRVLRLSRRFDLPAKIALAGAIVEGAPDAWCEALYSAQIRAFNGFFEHDSEGRVVKRGMSDFVISFRRLIQSIQANGYDLQAEPVPVSMDGVPINGAHRMAACVAAGRDVLVRRTAAPAPVFDYRFFRKRGLAASDMDLIARLSVRQDPSLRVGLVWPAARVNDQDAHEIVAGLGDVVYVRSVKVTWRSMVNLVRTVYEGEPWRGNWRNGYAGAQAKASSCFAGGEAVVYVLFRPEEGADIAQAKEVIRQRFRIGRRSIHICDTHQESVRVTELLCNQAGREFLALAPLRGSDEERLVQVVKGWAVSQGVGLEEFCVGGSAPLALLGVRPSRDVDVLCAREGVEPSDEVGSHNTYASYYGASPSEVVANPRLYFVYRGIKWASPELVLRMKSARGEAKDRRDVSLLRRRLAEMGNVNGLDWRYSVESARARGAQAAKIALKQVLPEAVVATLRKWVRG